MTLFLLLLTAIVTLNYFGQCFSQADGITQHYCPKVGVEYGSNITLSCSRVCTSGTSSRWQLTNTVISSRPYTVGLDRTSRMDKVHFEQDFGVTLTLSDDTCINDEMITFNLTIENVNENMSQFNFQCGVATLDVLWNTTGSLAVIFIENPVTPTIYKRTVKQGSDITFTCTRPCGVQALWRIQLPNNEEYYVSFLEIRKDFLNKTGVKIDVTDTSAVNCSLAQYELIPYSLSMYNINQNVTDANVSCGIRQPCDHFYPWFAPHVEQIFIEIFDPQIAINSTLFEITRPPESNVTLNCTRVCGPHIYDAWSFSLNNKTDFFVNNDPSKVTEIDYNNGVKLILCNIGDFDVCNGEIVEYFAHIYNLTVEIAGLIAKCEAIDIDTGQTWTASHSVQLLIDESEKDVAELNETVAELNETVAELNGTVAELNGTVAELNGTVAKLNGTIIQQSTDITVFKVTTGIFVFFTSILLVILIYMFGKKKDCWKSLKQNSVNNDSKLSNKSTIIANKN